MSYEEEFFWAFLKTQAVELSIVWGCVRWWARDKDLPLSTVLGVGFMATALTLPYLWFVLPDFFSNRTVYVLVGESAVTLVEALMYRQFLKLSMGISLAVSATANVASIVVGLIR